jgi:hypothetical protein
MQISANASIAFEHDPKVGKEKKLLYNGRRSFGALAHL